MLKKRLMSLVLCATLLGYLFPAGALAADIGTHIPSLGVGSVDLLGDIYYLSDANGELTTENADVNSYNLYYDSTAHTLSLNGATLASTLHVPGGTTIELTGENTLHSGSGIQAGTDGDITVQGDGSIAITSDTEGIATNTAPTASSGNILICGSAQISIANDQSTSIYARHGSITIQDAANVTVTTPTQAISCADTVTIRDQAEVTTVRDISADHIVIADMAKVQITDGDIGVNGHYGIDILDNSDVRVSSDCGGLNAFYGSVKIEGYADIAITGASNAAISVGVSHLNDYYQAYISGTAHISGFVGIGIRHGDVVIDGGTVAIDQSNFGIYTVEEGNIKIQNQATVSVSAKAKGIYAKNGIAECGDSTVASFGGEQAFSAAPHMTGAYKVTAGKTAADAQPVSATQLTDGVYTGNQYVKIEPDNAVTGVVLDRDSLSMHPGDTETLIATVSPADAPNRAVTWASSAPEVAAVADGVVTAVSTGTAVISATTVDGGKSVSCLVTVTRRSSSGGSSSSSSSTTQPDGSTTTTVTDPSTGTVIETTKTPDGAVTQVEKTTDGTVTTTEKQTDGTQVKTVATPEQVTAEVAVPHSGTKTEVTIPVPAVTPGTVAVLVKEDGTKEIVRDSLPTEDGVAVTLTGNAKLEIIDNSKPFADVTEDAWYAPAVDFTTARELLKGTGEETFSPALPTTRAMVVTMLYRLENEPDAANVDFADIRQEDWYSDAVAWAAASKVVEGVGEKQFAPEKTITRQELAVMLYRYAGYPAPPNLALDFADAGQVSGYAADALRWAIDQGIVTGKPGNRLDPKGDATRAEVAVMLQRYLVKR